MSTCSAAEIEEKRRIALEKLKAKKAQLNLPSNSNEIKKPATINKNSNVTSNSTQTKAGHVENKASSFLSALKSSDVFVQRQQVDHSIRDSAHPYKRRSTKGTRSFGTSTSPQKQIAPVFLNGVTCKVEIISVQRFEVQPSSYNAKLIEVFKTIPSRSYGNIFSFEHKNNNKLCICFQITVLVFGIFL